MTAIETRQDCTTIAGDSSGAAVSQQTNSDIALRVAKIAKTSRLRDSGYYNCLQLISSTGRRTILNTALPHCEASRAHLQNAFMSMTIKQSPKSMSRNLLSHGLMLPEIREISNVCNNRTLSNFRPSFT